MAGPRSSNGTPSGSRRIGLLGGTFDPPHHGHLEAARTALGALELDAVVLVVANDPWQKTAGGQVVTPAEVRLTMVRAAADGMDRIEVDDLEIRRGGPSYTADTVAKYAQQGPDDQLFVLVGSDIAPGLDAWARPDEIRRYATIVVMDRPGHIGARPPSGWDYVGLKGTFPDLTGTDLRAMVEAGGTAAEAVPEVVARLIEDHDLYETCR
ncbi:MAG: putative nicotinate-nucleotide adenylyltransferase [Acidimicrobiales bacterium]|nr:MAG: putative nicotinate-nucleotide adenylyltransferase [Acidimicrobiales bacterium]